MFWIMQKTYKHTKVGHCQKKHKKQQSREKANFYNGRREKANFSRRLVENYRKYNRLPGEYFSGFHVGIEGSTVKRCP